MTAEVQDQVEKLAGEYRAEHGTWPSARVVTQIAMGVLHDAGWTPPRGHDFAQHKQRPAARRPRVVQAGDQVPESVLDMFGWLQVRRYTERTVKERVGEVRAEIPCCTKGFDEVAGRKVVLRTDVDEQLHVVCPACRLLWRVELEREVDGGHLAVFELVADVALASARRTYTNPL